MHRLLGMIRYQQVIVRVHSLLVYVTKSMMIGSRSGNSDEKLGL